MLSAADLSSCIRGAVLAAPAQTTPFRHWVLRDVLPGEVTVAVCGLPVSPPQIGDTQGKRETHNATRTYFSPAARWVWPVAETIAEAFQARSTTAEIERRCGRSLAGSFLRIEYCQDTDGFWLEPHTDIRVKLLTLLIYLSQPPAGEEWGTDLYGADLSPAGHAPCAPGLGLLFLPAGDTWHGFRKRRITGVRRSLIINYVSGDWRARHELAYPDLSVA